MVRSRRPSAQTAAVIMAMAAKPSGWRYGYELSKELGIKPGSMYPILARLTERGILTSLRETHAPSNTPPKRMFRLTPPGRALAAELAKAAKTPTEPKPEQA